MVSNLYNMNWDILKNIRFLQDVSILEEYSIHKVVTLNP